MTLPRGGLIATAVVLALVGAFVGGRFSAPEQIKYEERDSSGAHTATVMTLVKYVDRTVTRTVVRDVIVKPDGTRHEHEEEHTEEKEKSSSELAKTVDRVEYRDREVIKTTTLRPDWRVGVLVGVSIREPFLPIAGPLVLGISVDRRIIGGLSAGVWVNTSGAAGLGVAFEF